MTANDEDASMDAIERCREGNRLAAVDYARSGVSREDITIGGIYSAFDLAAAFTGSRIGGIEWMRNALDVMERQIMAEARS